jgi:hypothetical protein
LPSLQKLRLRHVFGLSRVSPSKPSLKINPANSMVFRAPTEVWVYSLLRTAALCCSHSAQVRLLLLDEPDFEELASCREGSPDNRRRKVWNANEAAEASLPNLQNRSCNLRKTYG